MNSLLFSITIFGLISCIIFLMWYIKNCLKKLQFMSSSFESIDLNIQAYEKHLKTIYELEMYYGDETLKALLKHSQLLLTSFDELRKDYEIFNGDVEENDFFDEEETNSIKQLESIKKDS